MKTITEYEILSHGVENSQYFQGCGTAYTAFEDVATGIGDTEHEAFEDALESLAQAGWDVSSIEGEGAKAGKVTVAETLGVARPDSDEDEDAEDDSDEGCDCYFHVSVRVR